jgi:hypothetical protein
MEKSRAVRTPRRSRPPGRLAKARMPAPYGKIRDSPHEATILSFLSCEASRISNFVLGTSGGLIDPHFRFQLPLGFTPVLFIFALRTTVLFPDPSRSLGNLPLCNGHRSRSGPAVVVAQHGLRLRSSCCAQCFFAARRLLTCARSLGGLAAFAFSTGRPATLFPRHILLHRERFTRIHASINIHNAEQFYQNRPVDLIQ